MPFNLIAFLDPEPPQRDKDLKTLFVGREKELAQAVKYVNAARKQDPQRLLAVTGLARVGKSHLMRRTLAETKRLFTKTIYLKITPGQGSGLTVLREMLNQVTVELNNAAMEKGVAGPDGRPVLQPLLEIQRVYSEAIAGHADEIELSEARVLSESLRRQVGASFKTSGLVSLFGGPEIGLEASHTVDQGLQQSESQKVKVNRFGEDFLCELVGLAHELIRLADEKWRTLLVIDDFDILQRSSSGSFNPVPLMQQLFNLAQIEGLFVLTTVREDTYHQHDKVFYRIARVLPFGDDADLVEAFRRRVKLYHDGDDPFDVEMVEDIARRADGRMGVFFQWLKDLYDDGISADLPSWFKTQWRMAVDTEKDAAEIIRTAALERGASISREDAEHIRESSLQRFTLEDYSSFNNMRIDPMIRSLLLELADDLLPVRDQEAEA